MVGIKIENWQYNICDKDDDQAFMFCHNESQAKWTVNRLNMASDLEQLTYDIVVRDNSIDDLTRYVKKYLDKV